MRVSSDVAQRKLQSAKKKKIKSGLSDKVQLSVFSSSNEKPVATEVPSSVLLRTAKKEQVLFRSHSVERSSVFRKSKFCPFQSAETPCINAQRSSPGLTSISGSSGGSKKVCKGSASIHCSQKSSPKHAKTNKRVSDEFIQRSKRSQCLKRKGSITDRDTNQVISPTLAKRRVARLKRSVAALQKSLATKK